ncbi:hypothetical protein [Pseudoalteromonas sp.]|uniref:hypothetical protein n=1 Tax=Pseudoalteromonas sp. TaxID=53249 RepID=UPI00356978EB
MKRTILSALIFAPLFAGCVSTADTSADLDRNAVVAELTTRMDTLGYQYPVDIVPGINEFLNASAMVLERQYKVMGQYLISAENNKDAQAFLYANKDASPEELEAAIVKFDAGAKNEDEKIGHKLAAYNLANEAIYQQNVELATQLTIEVAKSALLLTEYRNEVAAALTLSATSSVISMFGSEENKAENPKDIGVALVKAKDQLALALEANEIIELEQATIASINEQQLELEAKG